MRSGSIENYLEYSFDHPTKKIIFDTKEILYFVLNLKEGQSIPKHRHEHSKMLLTVITGESEITVGDESAVLHKGDCVLVDGDKNFGISDVVGHFSATISICPRPDDERYSKEA